MSRRSQLNPGSNDKRGLRGALGAGDSVFQSGAKKDYQAEQRANGVLSGSILRLFNRAPRLPDMRSDSPQD